MDRSRFVTGCTIREREQLSIRRPREATEVKEDLIKVTFLPMSVAHLALCPAECGDDINAGFALLNPAECDVPAIRRPHRIEINGFLLGEPERLFGPDVLHIDTKVEAGSAVP